MKIQKIVSKLGSTGFFHVFGSSVINKIITFSSSIILVRLVSKAEYGVYSYANNILSFFILLSGLGVASGLLQIGSETTNDVQRKRIYSYACRRGLLFNIVLSVIVFVVALFAPFQIAGANYCLAIMAFEPCVTILYEMQCMYLRTDLRNRAFATSNSFATVSVFILSCLMAWLFAVPGLVAAKYIASLMTFAFIAWRFKISYPVGRVDFPDKASKRAFWEVSIISMLNNGLSRLMYLLDIFVLGIVIPSEVLVASYKVATTVPTGLSFIPGAIATYIYPYFVRRKDDAHWVLKRYLQLSGCVLGISLCIALPMVVFAPTVVTMVFGESYADAVPVFRILMVGFVISSTFRTIPGTILVTQRRLKFNLFTAVFSSVLNTVLNVILIPLYSDMGAAYATLLTVIVTSVLNVTYLLYCLKSGTTPHRNNRTGAGRNTE